MTFLIAFYLSWTAPPSQLEVRALRDTAPRYLTMQAAYWHLLAVRAAGVLYRIRPELLLAIAHHESNYDPAARTAEPGNRVSCGVMTPIPKRHCHAHELTLFNGYDIGAAHLRVWLDYCNDNESCALLAYVGGGGLVRVCKRQGGWRTPRGTNACDVPYQLRREARRISQALWAVSP